MRTMTLFCSLPANVSCTPVQCKSTDISNIRFFMLDKLVQAGETVYIPGGGGGVGHLAVQMAARVLGAGLVISGSPLQSTALARQSGAHYVFASVIELDESNVAGDDRVPLFSVAA